MANSYYVRSGAAGAGTGADWANAYVTMTAAIASKAAGDTFYISEDHAESTASAVTLTFPGTSASPNFVYCVDHAGTVPPVSADLRTTGTVTTTGNSNLILNGTAYINGVKFSAGSGAVSAAMQVAPAFNAFMKLENCALNKAGTTGTGSAITLAGNISGCWLVNTTMQFGATTDALVVSRGTAIWQNTPSAIQGATLPTTLITGGSGSASADFFITGVDLSALGSGKTLVGSVSNSQRFIFSDCKLGASVTVASTPALNVGERVDLIRCDSGATNYRDERYTYQGTQTVETTIVRTGGATDGTTAQAWKIVSTANSRWVLPFEAQPITLWNTSTSAITTLTIYGTTTGGGVPKDDEIWVEVEYLGSGSTPQGSFITSSKADNLAASAATNNSSDGSTWAGGGAGNGFKIVVPSFTPGMAGPINITIKAAKASTTYYIDPKPSISGVPISKSAILAPGVYANELGSGISRARAASGF